MFSSRLWQLFLDSFPKILLPGLTATIPLTIISFSLALVIAVVAALVQFANIQGLKQIARFYIWIFRGTPLLVQLFVVFFGLSRVGIVLDPFPAAVIVFSLNEGAYCAETIRAALESVPKGQLEAGLCAGLSYLQTIFRIVLPQAMRTAFPPLYRIISMIGVLFILYFGSRNVLGTGWKSWDVAVFTTFLSCFLKLAVKSSHAAKLFNAVHKAQVSWKRIKPLMKEDTYEDDSLVQKPGMLEVSHVSFVYPGREKIYEDFNLSAFPGQIIGVTGAVACGKSTLGKTFLCEYPYEGRIRFHGKELSEMTKAERTGMIGYLGHDPELFNDSVRNNILLGDDDDAEKYLKAVCFDGEVAEMEEGMDTIVGNGGVRLSGGQAQRLALARTLCHKRPVLILDDPFSALDRETEEEVFANLRKFTADSIVILLSHRLYLFPEMDQVLWMEAGKVTAGTHEQILEKFPEYARLYEAQADGADAHSTQEGGPDHAEK